MKYMTQNRLKKILSEGIHEVTFTKNDGSDRVMKATLDPSYLANVLGLTTTKSKTKKPENKEVVSCIDTTIGEWRSFRVDNVTSIER